MLGIKLIHVSKQAPQYTKYVIYTTLIIQNFMFVLFLKPHPLHEWSMYTEMLNIQNKPETRDSQHSLSWFD